MKQKLEIKAKEKGISELYMYGDISRYDINAREVGKVLKEMDAKTDTLEVRLLSGGGDVFEGIAIYNLLRQSDKKIKMYVDGLAASIASIIMLAGDEVYMGEGTQVMIHSPWTVAMGNSRDLQDTIDQLDRVEAEMIRIYKNRTDMPESQIAKMMSEETWFNSDEAIEYGFADGQVEISASYNIAASVKDMEWIRKKHLVKANDEFKNKLSKKLDSYSDFLARN